MNWKAMTKEQKQYVVLGVIVAGTAIYALFNFVLKPMLSGSGSTGKNSLTEMEAKLEEADQLVRQRIMLSDQYEATQKKLDEARREFLPASDNPLSWVTRQIYRAARAAQVEVESVEEQAQLGVNWTDKQMVRSFQPYSVRIQFKSSYFSLVDIVHELESANPYLAISSIAISPLQESVNRHQMQLLIEWPSVINPETFEALLKSGTTEPRAAP